ncbi:MAG: hypothetical protein B6I30_04470 [Desulfobacteraceae bacterium 4572_187]|nr:MAG: hypothetical protein B6I30_04470 [Desulfobacteraceae bacterium 4572_187]
MGPHPNDFHHLSIIKNLIDEPLLYIYSIAMTAWWCGWDVQPWAPLSRYKGPENRDPLKIAGY